MAFARHNAEQLDAQHHRLSSADLWDASRQRQKPISDIAGGASHQSGRPIPIRSASGLSPGGRSFILTLVPVVCGSVGPFDRASRCSQDDKSACWITRCDCRRDMQVCNSTRCLIDVAQYAQVEVLTELQASAFAQDQRSTAPTHSRWAKSSKTTVEFIAVRRAISTKCDRRRPQKLLASRAASIGPVECRTTQAPWIGRTIQIFAFRSTVRGNVQVAALVGTQRTATSPCSSVDRMGAATIARSVACMTRTCSGDID